MKRLDPHGIWSVAYGPRFAVPWKCVYLNIKIEAITDIWNFCNGRSRNTFMWDQTLHRRSRLADATVFVSSAGESSFTIADTDGR